MHNLACLPNFTSPKLIKNSFEIVVSTKLTLQAPVPADELPTQMDCGVMLDLPQTDLQV